MASVLKVTANGTTTSPILRGAWVLDRILGTPPPKPPADVEAVEPDIRGATTIRDQLAKHRKVASCASCHGKIDPPGFALENFDVIGGWRDHYRSVGNGEPSDRQRPQMRYLARPGRGRRRRAAGRPAVSRTSTNTSNCCSTTRTNSPAPWPKNCSPTPPARRRRRPTSRRSRRSSPTSATRTTASGR